MTTQEIIPAGAASDAPAQALALPQVNTAAAMTRAQYEVQSEYLLAMKMPRDENAAAAALEARCRRPSFAADAEYKFPRGTSEVTGPTIYLAREAARCWGRMRSGARVLERTEDEILIEGFAVDMQTIRIQTAQMRVKNKIQRKQKGGKTEWVEPDERDFAELVNRVAAKLERNCILSLLPSDVIEDAIKVARETLQRVAAGELDTNRAGKIKTIISVFSEYGVNKAHIEKRIGHPLEAVTPAEIADLGVIYKSVKEGQAGAAEFFDLSPAPTASEAKTTTQVDAARAKVDALKAPKAEGATPAEGAAQQ